MKYYTISYVNNGEHVKQVMRIPDDLEVKSAEFKKWVTSKGAQFKSLRPFIGEPLGAILNVTPEFYNKNIKTC